MKFLEVRMDTCGLRVIRLFSLRNHLRIGLKISRMRMDATLTDVSNVKSNSWGIKEELFVKNVIITKL